MLSLDSSHRCVTDTCAEFRRTQILLVRGHFLSVAIRYNANHRPIDMTHFTFTPDGPGQKVWFCLEGWCLEIYSDKFVALLKSLWKVEFTITHSDLSILQASITDLVNDWLDMQLTADSSYLWAVTDVLHDETMSEKPGLRTDPLNSSFRVWTTEW